MHNTVLNFIDGQYLAPKSGAFIENFAPATGLLYGKIARSDVHDVDLAVEAAEKAFAHWSQTPIADRAEILTNISQGITSRLQEFAEYESIDNGKPLSLAKKIDIPRSAQNFKFFADALTQFSSQSFETRPNLFNYTLHQPLGPVACISPWNLPLYLFTWKIAPALAAGCTVIAKPSELTPVTASLLGEIFTKAGLPPGVCNILHGLGSEVGSELVSHRGIKAISFTGGTLTGKNIAQIAAPQFKKMSLELGGKNPAFIFADAMFPETVEGVVRSSFTNQGQICLCSSRILVEESIYPKFKLMFMEKVNALRVGDPFDEATDIGALVSQSHLEKVMSYVALAKDEGGTILCGGETVRLEGRCQKGWFMRPTVIEGLPSQCRFNQEEIFGPIVSLIPFKNEQHALEIANDSSYGLSATIWTENLRRAHRVAHAVKSGVIWINTWMQRDLRTPFGGMKNSGLGREGGFEALKFFSETKNICIDFES